VTKPQKWQSRSLCNLQSGKVVAVFRFDNPNVAVAFLAAIKPLLRFCPCHGRSICFFEVALTFFINGGTRRRRENIMGTIKMIDDNINGARLVMTLVQNNSVLSFRGEPSDEGVNPDR